MLTQRCEPLILFTSGVQVHLTEFIPCLAGPGSSPLRLAVTGKHPLFFVYFRGGEQTVIPERSVPASVCHHKSMPMDGNIQSTQLECQELELGAGEII